MGVTVAKPSYALGLLGNLDALRDPAGRKFPWTPCMDAPVAWDEESPPAVKENAAKRCRGSADIPQCPALAACAAQAQRLILAGERPRGVWAGVVMPRQGEFAQRTVRRRSRNHSHLPPQPPDRFPVLV